MSRHVYVIAEQRQGEIMKITFELLGKARELADTLKQEVVAVLMGADISGKGELLAAYGADEVLIIEDEILEEYVTEPYAKAVCQVIRQREPEIVLFGASSIGRDLAPRVSARIHTGLTADCTGLEIEEETGLLLMTRPAFGGNIMATIVCENHRPQMATIRPGVMKAKKMENGHVGRIQAFPVAFKPEDMNVKVCQVVKETRERADITETPVVISGGRGLKEPENFKMLGELARLLKGEVAASRACVDADWIGKDVQVGQTGKTVRPQLYMACGISGAIQHTAGMEESELIIAINRDENAPIFQIADLGIVGDLHLIIPKLIQKLEQRAE